MPLADIVNVSLANDINVVYGTATRLVAAAGARMLSVCANKGNRHIALGDRSSTGANSMPAAYNPGAAASDGTSALPLKEGDLITMPAAQKEAFDEDEKEGIHLWHELVLWLASFNIQFDKACGAGK
jgi:hypothetical protein